MNVGVMCSLIVSDGAFDVGSGHGGWGMLYAHEFDAVCHICTTSEAALYASLVTMRNPKTMETPPVGVALIVTKLAYKAGLLTKAKQGSRAVYGFPLVNEGVPPVALIDASSGTQHKQHKQ